MEMQICADEKAGPGLWSQENRVATQAVKTNGSAHLSASDSVRGSVPLGTARLATTWTVSWLPEPARWAGNNNEILGQEGDPA